MPPKAKLHKISGKPKVLPPLIAQPSSSNQEPTPSLSPEQAQHFELELCWCIQQLQNALKSGKLNEKQIQDHTKALQALMNNNAPIIKKRQVMRLSFGDYRAKMAAEDKKLKGQSNKIKVAPVQPSKKSVFIKKSSFLDSTNNAFKFNFPTPQPEEIITNDISHLQLTNESTANKNENNVSERNILEDFHFNKSNNTFRFNFNCDT